MEISSKKLRNHSFTQCHPQCRLCSYSGFSNVCTYAQTGNRCPYNVPVDGSRIGLKDGLARR